MEARDDNTWKDLLFCIITPDGIIGAFFAASEESHQFKPLLLDNYRSATRMAHRMTSITGVGHTVSLYNIRTGAVMKREIPADTVVISPDGHRTCGLGDYVKRPVVNRETGETYESVSEAARATGIPRNAVTAVLTGRRPPTPGRNFSYLIVKPRPQRRAY